MVVSSEASVIELRPQPGGQEKMASTSADVAIYGGAAGGGKSYGLLLECLRHVMSVDGFGATIFRRTAPQIRNQGGLWDESVKIYSNLPAHPVESVLKWKFEPFGNSVRFSHLDHEKDVLNFQGSSIPLIGFDELTHFSKSQFFYMLSRNRSMCGVKPYVRATTNPDPDSWVADFISWWIDQDTGYPIQERSGVVRWFSHIGDDLHWADTREELLDRFPHVDPDDLMPKSFTFIAATLEDNQILMEKDPGYRGNLLALPRVQREQLLKGNWKIRPSAGDYFPEEKATIIEAMPNDIVKQCRGWDLAATKPTTTNPDPDSTSGVKLAIRKNGDIIVVDRKNKKITSDEVKNLVKNTAISDGVDCKIRIPQDPGQAGKDQAKSYTKLLSGYNITTAPVSGDKQVRSRSLSAQWHAGNVYILKGDWNDSYLSEMNSFPVGPHDDDVDSSNEAFLELMHGSNYNYNNL